MVSSIDLPGPYSSSETHDLQTAQGAIQGRVTELSVVPNHYHLDYHLVTRPRGDGEMSRFMKWAGGTHPMRYHDTITPEGLGMRRLANKRSQIHWRHTSKRTPHQKHYATPYFPSLEIGK
jgi:hypothetical protein